MAETKISALTVIDALADTDEVPIVDKSDTTSAATGTTKRITGALLKTGIVSAGAVGDAGAVMDSDFATSGVMARTGAGTYASRTITAADGKISVTNGDGVAGNPTVGLGTVALADLSDGSSAVMDGDFTANGLMQRTGAGTYATILINTTATTAPTVTDDSAAGYSVGSVWYDTAADEGYVCLDASVGAAVWKGTTSASGAGDVVGPASSTDNEIPAFDGTTGKLIQGTGMTNPASGRLDCVTVGRQSNTLFLQFGSNHSTTAVEVISSTYGLRPLSGDHAALRVSPTINPNAGSATISLIDAQYTINAGGAQTGAAHGIRVSATETNLNGIAHYLLELRVGGSLRFRVDSAGNVYMPNLPTADPATGDGRLWMDTAAGRVLKVST